VKVNPEQLIENGYIILKDVVPPSELQRLRDTFETLLDRQKEVWRAERKPDDPPGGVYESSSQPRVFFNEVVDDGTAAAAGFCLHENTLGVSRQLMNGPEAGVALMALMCSPVEDHGPQHWHRDMNPELLAPLGGLQTELLEGGISHTQWNIPLYDDSVFWIVPGSHRRPNTPEEQGRLVTDDRTPLPGSIPVELNAGDGVVYSNLLLHWGSNYSTKLRRTIHLGYRSFEGPTLSYVGHNYWRDDVTRLPGDVGRGFQKFVCLDNHRWDQIEVIFRAILDRDADRFQDALATLHPAGSSRMVSMVLMCRLADKVQKLNRPDIRDLPFEARVEAAREHRLSFQPYEAFAERFTYTETDTIWSHFDRLATVLAADADRFMDRDVSGSRFAYTDMPDFEVEDFIQDWN
tara:strand:- start:10066 stop:11280 length:1215 start_codon:yes stop_codon:yes gene_type:complete